MTDLRLEVAKILGWKRYRYIGEAFSFLCPPSFVPHERVEACGDEFQWFTDAFDDVPDWPNNDLAAWRDILPEIKRRGLDWSAHSLANGGVTFHIEHFDGVEPMIVGGVGHVVGGDPDNWHWPQNGKTLAEAMCKSLVEACKFLEKKDA